MRWADEFKLNAWPHFIGLAKSTLARQPDNPALHLSLGEILIKAGDLAGADAHLEQAIAKFPAHASLFICRARVLEQLGAFEHMAEVAKTALQLAPGDKDATHVRYQALRKLGQKKKASAFFTASGALQGYPQARSRLLIADGAWQQLADECHEFLAAHPGDTGATFHLAVALAKLDRGGEARAMLSLERDVAITALPLPADMLDQVAAEILDNPSLASDPRGVATRQGRQTRQLRRAEANAVETLIAEIKRAIDDYAAQLPPGDFTDACPREVALQAWAVASGTEGHQNPHFHPGGWLSGVFYVSGVRAPGDSVYRGPLVMGAVPLNIGLADPPWGTREVEPIPGRLILFPSYIPHATRPPGIDGSRIVVAFDVVRASAQGINADAHGP